MRLTIALSLAGLATLVVASATAAESGERSPIVVHVERGGFHWSDAAVGLLAGIGLTVAAACSVALLRLRDASDPSNTEGERT